MACHLASKCGCELLVCDRTFASLDAIGERMLGYWAKLGMRYIGCWWTDVVKDYLSVRAPKLVLQVSFVGLTSYCCPVKRSCFFEGSERRSHLEHSILEERYR
jgi:hypothetical protein